MDILLKQANINQNELKRFVLKRVAYEIGNLTEPCYYPSLKKDYYYFLNLSGLKERDVKEYVKRFYKGTPASKWLLHNDPITNLHIALLCYSLDKKDVELYSNLFLYFMIRVYTNIMNKQIKICNADAFRFALNNLSRSHLFSRENSIPAAIAFMANELIGRYSKHLKEKDLDGITKFITESRHRISQSAKSFAEIYYKAVKEGKLIKQDYEVPEGEEGESLEYKKAQSIKGERIVLDIVDKICIYKYVDKKSLEESKNLTKIDLELSNRIVNELCDLRYKETIKNLLHNFILRIENIDQLCGKEFFSLFNSTMRKSKENVYFKQQSRILFLNVVDKLDLKKTIKKFTEQTQRSIYIFIILYLILTLRNKLCL